MFYCFSPAIATEALLLIAFLFLADGTGGKHKSNRTTNTKAVELLKTPHSMHSEHLTFSSFCRLLPFRRVCSHGIHA
jgi:hypothetical protein